MLTASAFGCTIRVHACEFQTSLLSKTRRKIISGWKKGTKLQITPVYQCALQ